MLADRSVTNSIGRLNVIIRPAWNLGPFFRRGLRPRVVAVTMSLLLAQAASAQKITAEFDESVDFAKFKTFTVRDGRLNARNPALNNDLTKKHIVAQIEAGLADRGLKKSDTPASDLNVFYTFGAVRQVETETYPRGWRGLGTGVARVPYAEGTLVIDLKDPSTHSLVWRGIAVEQESDPGKLADRLDKMIAKALKKYPPKK
jgi:hypothetical protein